MNHNDWLQEAFKAGGDLAALGVRGAKNGVEGHRKRPPVHWNSAFYR
jgi:hypothetical protein